MKKKMTLMIVAAGLFVLAIVGGSIAYFTADTRAKNAITAGNLGVELKVDEEKVSQYIENNGLKVSGALPGDRYDYPIYAYNSGDFPSYIRITLTKYWSDSHDEKNFDADSAKILLENNNSDWIIDTSDENNEVVYCYYKKPIDSKTSTTHVVDAIKIADLKNADQDLYSPLTIKVDVEVDAIQKVAAKDAILAEWGLDAQFDSNGNIVSISE